MKRCILDVWQDSEYTTYFNTQQTFRHCFYIVLKWMWNCDVRQCHINVETTLCMSTMKFILFVYFKVDNVRQQRWTTLDNVEIALSFSTSMSVTLENVETMLGIWPFANNKKFTSSLEQNNIFELQIKTI